MHAQTEFEGDVARGQFASSSDQDGARQGQKSVEHRSADEYPLFARRAQRKLQTSSASDAPPLVGLLELVTSEAVLAKATGKTNFDSPGVRKLLRELQQALRDRTQWQVLTPKPVQAGEEEVRNNPRARSAKLRAAVRVTG